jgi:fatty-acyl-CoA synthase/long-chain acyl-CoA synthetase
MVDRKNDLILRGGYDIIPSEIENVLYADLRAHCRAAGLPSIEGPGRVLTLDALPKNAVGKIAKRSMVEIAAQGGAR